MIYTDDELSEYMRLLRAAADAWDECGEGSPEHEAASRKAVEFFEKMGKEARV